MAPQPPDDVSKVVDTVEDAVSYPLLVTQISGDGDGTRAGTANGGASASRAVENAMTQVLGWRPRRDDPSGFLAALNQSFTLEEVDGRTEWKWRPRTFAVSAELGAITGAQASIHQRARGALDASLPLLDGLHPLTSDFDPQDAEAMRTIIRSELTELVNELGTEGGPRVQRVDALLELLLGPNPDLSDADKVKGQLGVLRDRFDLFPQRVNTIDEERTLTNFLILVDYVNTLAQSWQSYRHFFDRTGRDVFLGTQLVLLSRSLGVVAETVHELYDAMDSVFLGPTERETTRIPLDDGPALTIGELLRWVETFSVEEGPRLVQEAGKDGVIAFRSTIDKLEALVREALTVSKRPGNPTRAFHTGRVRRAFEELSENIEQAAKLARQIRRFPRPDVSFVAPSEASAPGSIRVTIDGANFQSDAAVRLLPPRMTYTTPSAIRGVSVTVVADRQVKATLPLGNAVPGQWMVEVENPDGQTNDKASQTAFLITKPVEAVEFVAADGAAAGRLKRGVGIAVAANGFLLTRMGQGLFLATPDGQVSKFTQKFRPVAGTEEYIAINPGLGAWSDLRNHVFVTQGSRIVAITPDGGVVENFAVIPADVRGHTGITFDREGTFEHDMIVTDASGNVYRVDRARAVTPIARVGTMIENPAVVPTGFGPLGGQIWVAAENKGTIFAIDEEGEVTPVVGGIPKAENVTVIPRTPTDLGSSRGCYFAVDHPDRIVTYPASHFDKLGGNVLVGQEIPGGGGGVFMIGLNYNGRRYVTVPFDREVFVGQAEGAAFVDPAVKLEVVQSNMVKVEVDEDEATEEQPPATAKKTTTRKPPSRGRSR